MDLTSGVNLQLTKGSCLIVNIILFISYMYMLEQVRVCLLLAVERFQYINQYIRRIREFNI